MMFEDAVKNEFKRLVMGAMWDARRAHECVFGTEEDPIATGHESDKKAVALSYAASSVGKSSAARALYLARYEILRDFECEKIFSLFETFASELQQNFAEDHSHQWSDLEFDTLKEFYEASECSKPIQE